MTRLTFGAGAVLGVLGFVAALLSLAIPWATYRVSVQVPGGGGDDLNQSGDIAVFQLDRGWLYVAAVLSLLGLLALAATTTGGGARAAGLAAVLLGCLVVVLATTMASTAAGGTTPNLPGMGAVDVRTSRGTGGWYGSAAGALLGLAAALLAVRRPRDDGPHVAESSDRPGRSER